MATLVLAAAGAALGGSFGGTVLGLSGAVIGKAVGSVVGSVLDQTLLGGGGEAVETGRVNTFRVQNASEGASVPRVAGRMRVAGQMIWSTRFKEHVRKSSGGGKGIGGGPTVREYSYSVSIAIALCQGEVVRVGRVWADGHQFSLADVEHRLHRGTTDQMPDPLIEAMEGTAPAYRGTAYLVLENLDVTQFGNRIPQFNVEVFRQPVLPAEAIHKSAARPSDVVRGVALVPGTGEYSLSPTPVSYAIRKGENRLANVNNAGGEADLVVSLSQLGAELPQCDAVSLVVSWFGDDLRCDQCRIEPAVEQTLYEAPTSPWSVSGTDRATAKTVSQEGGRPNFGGTPSDASVVDAIALMNSQGRRVMFYPFILMDVPAGNGLTDPWTGGADQPVFPWRGRITLSTAPGQAGSPDKTAAAAAEVAAFFGVAQPGDFAVAGKTITYTGALDWGLRRFILHYAHLCALAGGVEAFCISSEMRSLTQIRDSAASYPAVQALRSLAADVKAILPGAKIGYAADWSEYFGHQPGDGSGDVFFHLDPLWSDSNIDFIGIDNYMPLSDWRDKPSHLDDGAGSIHDLDYLRGNVAGGEGYAWYYASAADRDAQIRSPIADGAFGEDWVFRPKDLLNWWSQPHHNRPGGVRNAAPTAWVPESKPIWFTELGCPAVDKGTNQPNVFIDPKSSESFAPYYSTGARDDFIQIRYLQAMYGYWGDSVGNPVSSVYGGQMVDLSHAYVWAWDARPWPDFPARQDVWADGPNYLTGHWISGRMGAAGLAEVVAEICGDAGLGAVDVSDLHGLVSGYLIESPQSARSSLQPLMLAYGFDAIERSAGLGFRMRSGQADQDLHAQPLALRGDDDSGITRIRAPQSEVPEAVRITYLEAENAYQAGAAEASESDAIVPRASASTLPIALASGQGQVIAERWLSEARVARDRVSFGLPPSMMRLEAGDVVSLPSDRDNALYRVDRVEDQGARLVEAQRIESGVYGRLPIQDRGFVLPPPAGVAPLDVTYLDLPLLKGDEVVHAPWVAAAATPWPGPIAVYISSSSDGYTLNTTLETPSIVGTTLDDLSPGRPWLWDRGPGIRVEMSGDALFSRPALDVLNGANAAAIRANPTGDWEVFQFREAVLEATNVYRISGLLRGQAGTEHLAAITAPAGAELVLLDGGPAQIDLPLSARGLDRYLRAGPASKGYDDPSYDLHVGAFAGIGLRPYSPVHLRASRQGQDLALRWTRRTRIDGDSWAGMDVPLSEDLELYEVRIIQGNTLVRSWQTTSPNAVYSTAAQGSDQITLPFSIEVSQISAQFGVGPSTRIIQYV